MLKLKTENTESGTLEADEINQARSSEAPFGSHIWHFEIITRTNLDISISKISAKQASCWKLETYHSICAPLWFHCLCLMTGRCSLQNLSFGCCLWLEHWWVLSLLFSLWWELRFVHLKWSPVRSWTTRHREEGLVCLLRCKWAARAIPFRRTPTRKPGQLKHTNGKVSKLCMKWVVPCEVVVGVFVLLLTEDLHAEPEHLLIAVVLSNVEPLFQAASGAEKPRMYEEEMTRVPRRQLENREDDRQWTRWHHDYWRVCWTHCVQSNADD